MTGFSRNATDKNLKGWLAGGPVDRGIGEGLTFVATKASARLGRGSWILRYRWAGKNKEKVLGRYPDVSLKEARDLARQDRVRLQQGIDVASAKQCAKRAATDRRNVADLGRDWYARHIAPKYTHPTVVERVLRTHIVPVLGRMPVEEVRPVHIDDVLTRIVRGGAPTVANDALRYLFRMFHHAVKRRWVEVNPVAGFEQSDAGGTERSRERWLDASELTALGRAMRTTPNFGRVNELAVWLLLALCVRKMELLSARWDEFDLDGEVWRLVPTRTKSRSAIGIPLAPPVVAWLDELKTLACGSPYLFPARRLIHLRHGVVRRNRFEHISPDTLNVALRRLHLADVEHFTIHDMRRTARTHLAALGVDRFVAERALNHKLRHVEGTYNRYDYFEERKNALGRWASMLQAIVEERHAGGNSSGANRRAVVVADGTRTGDTSARLC